MELCVLTYLNDIFNGMVIQAMAGHVVNYVEECE